MAMQPGLEKGAEGGFLLSPVASPRLTPLNFKENRMPARGLFIGISCEPVIVSP